MSSQLRTFLPELERRKVFRVAVAYAAGAFVVRQGADFVLPATRVPGWAPTLVLVPAVLSSPVALVLAWASELSLEGSL